MYAQAKDHALAHTYHGRPYADRLIPETSILSFLEKHAREKPYAIFLIEAQSAESVISISFKECYQYTLKWSSWAKLNLKFNDKLTIALFPANDLQSVIAILGVLNLGGSILFLNPANPAKRSKEQLEKLDVDIILRSSQFLPDVYPSSQPLPGLAEIHRHKESVLNTEIDPLKDAFYIGTSGSTAASKVVAQSHYNAIINAIALKKHHHLNASSKVLGCLPIYHVNGLHFTIMANLISGSQAVITHNFDPFNFIEFIKRFKPSIVSIVPSILEALLEIWRDTKLPNELRYFVTAAAPLSVQTAREVYERWNRIIVQGYGLTETTNFSTLLPGDISKVNYRDYMLRVKTPSIGTPILGNEVAILHPGGQRAEEGETGEICMRGHNVMNGYYKNDEANIEVFRNGWFHSGDLGYELFCKETGKKLIYITGRTKNVAKVKGIAVSLEEMEREILSLTMVKDVVCIPKKRKYFDEEIIVAWIPAEHIETKKIYAITAHLKTVFPLAVIPDRFIVLDYIPKTNTGKLRRAELLDMLHLT